MLVQESEKNTPQRIWKLEAVYFKIWKQTHRHRPAHFVVSGLFSLILWNLCQSSIQITCRLLLLPSLSLFFFLFCWKREKHEKRAPACAAPLFTVVSDHTFERRENVATRNSQSSPPQYTLRQQNAKTLIAFPCPSSFSLSASPLSQAFQKRSKVLCSTEIRSRHLNAKNYFHDVHFPGTCKALKQFNAFSLLSLLPFRTESDWTSR